MQFTVMSVTTRKIQGVLFDLDGVLLDSEGQYSIFWRAMDERFPTGVEDFSNYIKGFHLARILGYFANDEIREQIVQALVEFEKNMRFEFFPGAIALVKRLRDMGIPMAIVTSSDHKKMQALFSQHPEFPALFDTIITGDMVTRAKPDPDCFLLGAQRLGVDIKDCVVFEDSRNGLIAARASGARVIGIATTLSADIVAPLSDLTIPCVNDLDIEQIFIS
jgi:HAD superfamily hydrolase (TIGR01509 family)